MPSLLASMMHQYRPLAESLAAQLFEANDFSQDPVQQHFGEGNFFPQTSFGFALAEAVGKQGAQALIQGMSAHDVGLRMGRGLNPLGPQFIADGLNVFASVITAPDVPQWERFVERHYGGHRSMSFDVKKELMLGISHDQNFSENCHAAVINTLSDHDKNNVNAASVYTLPTHLRTMEAAREPNAPPLLDLVRQVMSSAVAPIVDAVFEDGRLPEVMLLDFHDRQDHALANQAGKFALAEALAERVVQGLKDGQPLSEMGRRLAQGMVLLVDAEHCAYGLEHLKVLIATDEHPTLRALAHHDALTDFPTLTTDAKKALMDGMFPELSETGRPFVMDVLTDTDKKGELGTQKAFDEAVKMAQASMQGAVVNVRTPTSAVPIPNLGRLNLDRGATAPTDGTTVVTGTRPTPR